MTIHPLDNDNAGDDGTGVVGTLDPATMVFTSAARIDAGRTGRGR